MSQSKTPNPYSNAARADAIRVSAGEGGAVLPGAKAAKGKMSPMSAKAKGRHAALNAALAKLKARAGKYTYTSGNLRDRIEARPNKMHEA